jgi:hypothetical protein
MYEEGIGFTDPLLKPLLLPSVQLACAGACGSAVGRAGQCEVERGEVCLCTAVQGIVEQGEAEC